MAHHKHKTNRRSFTPRKRRLLENLVSGKFASNYRAAIAAGYAPGATAKNAASRVLKETRQHFPELLDRIGLTDEALIKRHLIPALNAEEIRLAQRDGKFTDTVAVPDWNTRTRALEMAFQLCGAFARSKGTEGTPPVITVQVIDIAEEDATPVETITAREPDPPDHQDHPIRDKVPDGQRGSVNRAPIHPLNDTP